MLDNPMEIVVLAAFGLIFLQGIFSALQYRSIRKKYKEVKGRSQLVSVGKVKRFGRARISMLAFSSDGFITEAYILSGFTVFARFRRLASLEGKHYNDIEKSLTPSFESDCIMQAVWYYTRRLEGIEAEKRLEEEAASEALTEQN